MLEEKEIQEVVERVLREVRKEAPPAASPAPPPERPPESAVPQDGVFPSLDDAVEAARQAQECFSRIPFHERGRIIEEVRRSMYPHCRALAELAVQDTGIGRVDDKVVKNQLALDKSFGTEDIETHCESGGYGIMLEEMAPFGVIGSITPTTNPTSTIINHMIIMPAGGNTVVFNFHPNAAVCCTETLRLMNRAFVAAGGPPNIGTTIEKPTIRSAIQLMEHPQVDLLVVTGGPAVVERAMKSGKRVLAAGPGNPPVVVDETADLELAGREIVTGAALDNNVLCICEKEVFVVETVAEQLIENMRKSGAYLLNAQETQALEKVLITPDDKVNKDFIGKDAGVILAQIGVQPQESIALAICEVSADHPFVRHEMMLPVLPIVRVGDFAEAVAAAKQAEHGFGHTAMIFSRDMDRITQYAREMKVNLFAANGNCATTLGYEAEGCTALTIAGPTGEGVTRPRTFVRSRRVVINNALHTT